MPSLSERVASAFFGAIIGGIVGCVLAWLLGVYSNTLGPSSISLSFSHWVVGSSIIFALLGFVLGRSIGSLLGDVINGIYVFERGDDGTSSWWVWLLVLLVAAGLAFTSFGGHVS